MIALAIAASIPWAAITTVSCGQAVGTAFHIGGGRYITAAHVVNNGECTIAGLPAPKVAVIPELDFAEVGGPVDRPKFDISCDGFGAGKEYLAIGYALGKLRVTLPLLNSAFGKDGNNSMFVGGDMIPGMSGGPMIDRAYRVSGINLQRWPSGARSLSETYLCGAK